MGVNEEEKRLVESFIGIRDVYRNSRKMLLSCDPILADENSYTPYNWAAVFGVKSNINQPDTWLPNCVIRQYKPFKQAANPDLYEILTIGAAPWRCKSPFKFVPMCVASRMFTTKTPDDVYFISMSHTFEEEPRVDGEVHAFSGDLDLFEDSQKGIFVDIVHQKQLISIAVPLLEITNTSKLFERIVNPLLDYPWP